MQLHKHAEPPLSPWLAPLSKEELSAGIGKHRTTIDRSGLDPQTMEQPNHAFGEQPPRLLLPRIEGLNRVANTLDALRG